MALLFDEINIVGDIAFKKHFLDFRVGQPAHCARGPGGAVCRAPRARARRRGAAACTPRLCVGRHR
eukprot:6445661-Prymnesium_polylepis.1